MKQHPLEGYKQSPEHVRRRMESIRRAKAKWAPERHELFRSRVSASNRAGEPEVRQRISEGHKGQVAWNKGNDWQAEWTAEQVRDYNAKRARKRRAENPGLRVHQCVSSMMRQALKGNKAGRRWESLVGYNLAELMAHLESLFQSGMNWANQGEWHIDHIIPRSAFHFDSAEDGSFQECWALDNLQPLWAKDNLRKNAAMPHQEE